MLMYLHDKSKYENQKDYNKAKLNNMTMDKKMFNCKSRKK